MTQRTATLLLTTIALFPACSTPDAQADGTKRAAASERTSVYPDSMLRVDASTPDQALRSIWRLTDLDTLNLEGAVDSTAPGVLARRRLGERYRGLLTGEALAAANDTQRVRWTYKREIVDVEQQTPTRAIVTARIRNTTPIPPGATPDEYDVRVRRDGNTYRYIMEKDSAGWRLAQVESKLVDDWRQHYSTTPTVPTWTNP